MNITISLAPDLTAHQFVDILRRSTLAERRPVDEPERIATMLKQADILAIATNEHHEIVGVARAITDYAFCTYLSDLAVDVAYQRQGIGKRLIEFVRDTAGHRARLILLSAPGAVSYYPHIGMKPHGSCWMIDPSE